MITSAGPKCDVCDCFILPGFSMMNFFKLSIFTNELHSCDKCKEIFEGIEDLEKDWQQLPDGNVKNGIANFMAGKQVAS